MGTTDADPADWTLEPLAPEERDLLRRLFEFYLYDFSEMEHADVDAAGWFLSDPSRYVGRYWTDPDRHALLLRVHGKPAGFVLVNDHSPIPNSGHRRYVSDFFVMRAYRRRGYGTAMARATLLRWPGEWQVLEIRANPDAQQFWRRTIGDLTGGQLEERWVTQREVVQEFRVRGERE